MNKILVKIMFFSLLLLLPSCRTLQTVIIERNVRKTLNEYCEILKQNDSFLQEKSQIHFKEDLRNYMKNCKDYNFYQYARNEPLICFPLFANSFHNKVLVPVLTRKTDMKGERVEYIHYVSGKFENGKWDFQIRKGHSESFSYIGNYPTLPDSEVGRRVVRNLLLYHYIKEGETTREEIFKSDLYMYKDFSLILDSNEISKRGTDLTYQKRIEVVDLYCEKLKESNRFLSAKSQKHFEDSVLSYINHHSFFKGKVERFEPIVSYPILFEGGKKKASVLVIKRYAGILGEKIDEVYFLSAKFEKGKWEFHLNESAFMTFNYEKNELPLSDTEIGIKIIEKMELSEGKVGGQ